MIAACDRARISLANKSVAGLTPQSWPARDREHAVALIQAGVAFQVREILESALALGERTLLTIGSEPEAADEIMAEVRRRDAERLDLETVGGIYAGLDLIRGNAAVPAH